MLMSWVQFTGNSGTDYVYVFYNSDNCSGVTPIKLKVVYHGKFVVALFHFRWLAVHLLPCVMQRNLLMHNVATWANLLTLQHQ